MAKTGKFVELSIKEENSQKEEHFIPVYLNRYSVINEDIFHATKGTLRMNLKLFTSSLPGIRLANKQKVGKQ